MITKGLVEVDDILIRKYLLGVWSFLCKKDLVIFCFAYYIHVTRHDVFYFYYTIILQSNKTIKKTPIQYAIYCNQIFSDCDILGGFRFKATKTIDKDKDNI